MSNSEVSTSARPPIFEDGLKKFHLCVRPRPAADASLLSSRKVTPEHVDRCIKDLVFDRKEPTLTLAYATLFNGAKLVGFNYGSIDVSRQNWELGEKMALSQIKEEIFKLEGYQLRNLLLENDPE